MLLRISLIVAILAGLGAGGVAYYEVSTQIPQLQQQRDTEKSDKQTAQKELASTKATLKKTEADLALTKQDLAETKSERDKALARADAETKRADDLNTKLAKANSDLQDSRNTVAEYQASGLKPEEVVALDKQYKDALKEIVAINGEKAVLQRQYASVKAKYDSLVGPQTDVLLPAAMKGKILVVDPKWSFVVLNVGGDQGAIENGEMLVSRDGKLVAKVVIRTVEKNRCIANVVPGWKFGDLYEGDVVTPAHPASS